LRLIVRPDAEADIAAAYDWYEEQRKDLGKEFLEEISVTIDPVQADPKCFPAIFRTLRRALVHRFPMAFSSSLAWTQSLSSQRHISPGTHGAFTAAPSQTSSKTCMDSCTRRAKTHVPEEWRWTSEKERT
jgi:plasmid stabilization system protein ParE